MVTGPRWRDVIGGFFGEDRGIVGKFWGKGLLWLCFFSSGSKFSGSGDFGDFFFQGGTSVKEMGPTSDNPVEGSVCVGTGQELGFFFPSVILKESGISDCVDVGMPRGSIGGFLEVGVMVGGVGGVGEVEVFRLIEGLIDR